MREPAPEPAVTLTGGGRPTRAALGPTAWAVLEELTLAATPNDDGRLVVTTSVRRLAATLGLDKDTVARALGRLGSAGFVFRRAFERPTNGSCYVLTPIVGLNRVGFSPVLLDTAVRPSDGDSPQCPEVGDGSRRRRPRRSSGAAGGRTPQDGQLSLLGDDATPDDATTDAPSQTPPSTTSTRPSTLVDQRARRSS